MSKLSYSVKFYALESRPKNGKLPLYCRININRKKAEFALREFVDPKKWNPEAETVKGDPEMTARLHSIYNELKGIRDNILDDGRTPTSKEIKDIFLNQDEGSTSLLEYVAQYIDQIELLPHISVSTSKKYKTIHRHLKDFLKSRGFMNVSVKGFKPEHVKEFEFYLNTTANLSVNTSTKYLKLLKTVFNRAMEFGKANNNPMEHIKFKHERTNRTFLTNDELKRIESVELPNQSLDRVRNLFLFSCFTGLRFTDVDNLTPKSIIKDQNGNNWIEIQNIQKTGDAHRMPLFDKANEIIQLYKDEAEITGKLLPLRSNQKVNAYLKVIADMCGIDKNLTFHVARHTFATTVTLSNHVPVEIVSQMLGHKDIKTTQIYAKITNQYMQEYADKLNKKL